MRNTGIKPEVFEEILQFAKKYRINKIILFGSRARGDYHRASDIDLAVCGGNIDGFTLDVEEKTSTLLEYDVIDLSQPLQEKLLRAIESEGILLYEEI